MVAAEEAFPALLDSPITDATEQQDLTLNQHRSHQTGLFITTFSSTAKDPPPLLWISIYSRWALNSFVVSTEWAANADMFILGQNKHISWGGLLIYMNETADVTHHCARLENGKHGRTTSTQGQLFVPVCSAVALGYLFSHAWVETTTRIEIRWCCKGQQAANRRDATIFISVASALPWEDRKTLERVDTLCLLHVIRHLLSFCQNGQDLPPQFQ